MINLNVKWSEPSKIKTKYGEQYRREWLIPAGYRSIFFDYWRFNSFKLKDKGYGVYKKDKDWFLTESKVALHHFEEYKDTAPSLEESDFILLPKDVKDVSGLRSWQVNSVGKLHAALEKWDCAIDGSDLGIGKCHPAGTTIRMFDGSLKKVENIIIGDKLMGDDSTPRNVLSTSKGNGDLFKIHPYKGGEPFGVNGYHILVLKNTKTKEIIEISVRDYIFKCTSSTQFHSEWKLFRTGVEYFEKEISINPYFLGLWLGDGTWCRMEISVADIDVEIQQFLIDFSKSENLKLVVGKPKKVGNKIAKCKPFNLRGKEHGHNSLLTKTRELGLTLNKEKFIPENYLHNNRKNRLDLLAGIIDSDGSMYANGGYEVSCKYDLFCDQVIELSRSLGYGTTTSKIDRTWSYKGKKYTNKYWRISISGANDLPCKLKRKFSKPRLQPKNVLHTSFGVEPIGIGDYYGFTIDGNNRYLMKDFTVTHNTYIACAVARELDMDILVVCPKAVMETWHRVVCNHFSMKSRLRGIIDYEMLRIGKAESNIASYVKNKKTHKEEFIWKIPKETLIIWDESQKLKGSNTQNSKTCLHALKQGYKMLFCSATNATNPLELRTVGMCLQLFKNGKQYYQWLYSHGVDRGRFGLQFNNSKDVLKKLHKDIFIDRGVRLTRDTIPNFPESEIIAECYNMEEESTKQINAHYDEMYKELAKLKRKEKSDKASELTAVLRARQKIELVKVPLFIDMIEEGLENGMSVVVFVNFTETINALAKRLNTNCIVNGLVSDIKRTQNVDNFQDDKERVILVNIQAGGSGLSLHDINGKYPRLSLLSPSYSAICMRQATGRVWRDSAKSKSVQKIVFVADTVEEKVCESVNAKLKNLDLLNDGDLSL